MDHNGPRDDLSCSYACKDMTAHEIFVEFIGLS
jgi:hypothetical protein